MGLSGEFLQERITKTKEQIVLYEDAISFLAANPTRSYRLDTGQSVQDVTRFNIKDLQYSLDGLYNRLSTLDARATGNGVTQVRPCF